jgi:hypothetical protein
MLVALIFNATLPVLQHLLYTDVLIHEYINCITEMLLKDCINYNSFDIWYNVENGQVH